MSVWKCRVSTWGELEPFISEIGQCGEATLETLEVRYLPLHTNGGAIFHILGIIEHIHD